jgi:uncharacterized protein
MMCNPDRRPDPAVVQLDREECLELLGRVGIGRVVLSSDCIPVALPVCVSVIDEEVVFADIDSKLDAAVGGEVVTVEADEVDRVCHTGWSVLVTGVARVVPETDDIRKMNRSASPNSVPWTSELLVRVPATRVSGHRFAWHMSATPPAIEASRDMPL